MDYLISASNPLRTDGLPFTYQSCIYNFIEGKKHAYVISGVKAKQRGTNDASCISGHIALDNDGINDATRATITLY